jgi:hypothetical protein
VTGAGPSATPITFEAGKRYTFKLDLDAYSRLIIFNPPTVTEWDKSDPEEEISAGIVKKLTSDQQFWLAAQSVYDTWWNNNNVPLGTAGTGMGYNLTQNPVGFATGCAALGNNKTIGWRVMTKAEYDKYRNDIKAPGFIIGFNGNGDIHLADQSGSGDQNSLWWSCSGWSPTVGSGYPSKQNKRTSFCIRPATPQQ